MSTSGNIVKDRMGRKKMKVEEKQKPSESHWFNTRMFELSPVFCTYPKVRGVASGHFHGAGLKQGWSHYFDNIILSPMMERGEALKEKLHKPCCTSC